jgi:hypothetical protein
MRRYLVLLALAGLIFAGCGSSSSSGGTPRDTELSYFPSGAPFVALLATDPNGKPVQDANGFVGRFPFGRLGIAALQSKLAQSGINYQRDIKPLLGNPIALGAPTSSILSGRRFLLVFVAKDAGKLAALATRKPAPQSIGSHDGAKLYQSGNYVLAIDGATALLAPSADDVKAALDRHAHGGGITAGEFSHALAGLPQDSILQVYGNLAGVLATPRAASARTVPWVAAIRSYGVTLSVSSTGIAVNYRVDTSGRALSPDQLPLATGSTSPNVSAQAPIVFGLHDLAHVINFVLAAEQASKPTSYADFLKREARLRSKTGVDLNKDVFAQLSGNLEVDYSANQLLARAEVADPTVAARSIAKLSTSSGELFSKRRQVTRLQGGFYAVKSSSKTITYGVVGNQFVLGTATPAQLRAFAAAPASPVAGAQGPAAFRLNVASIVSLALKASHRQSALPPAAQSVLNMFSDVTGWAANDPSGLHGSLTVPLK